MQLKSCNSRLTLQSRERKSVYFSHVLESPVLYRQKKRKVKPKDDPLRITFCPSVNATKRNRVAKNRYKELQNYCQFLKLRKLSSACNTEAADIAHKLHSLYRENIH